jgi:hypothetical protein
MARPKLNLEDRPVRVLLQMTELEGVRVDELRRAEHDLPSRPEMIRRILARAIPSANPVVKPTPAVETVAATAKAKKAA